MISSPALNYGIELADCQPEIRPDAARLRLPD
jgi:hypothetical protein